MNTATLPAAKIPTQRLLTLARKIAVSFVVGMANVSSVASAGAQEFRGSGADTTSRYDDAVSALTAQRYIDAYGRFAALADEGHAPSALMSLAIVTYRPSLSGPPWSATPAQLQRWSALVAHEEREHRRLIAEVKHRE